MGRGVGSLFLAQISFSIPTPPSQEPPRIYDDIYKLVAKFSTEVPRSNLQMLEALGKGAFGMVHRAQFVDSGRQVAAKSLAATSAGDASARAQFLQEAAIQAQFKHDNVVQLVGMVTRDLPMLILLEICEQGELLRLLIRAPRSVEWKLRAARDVATGAAYLASRGFVHRDLACRNVLVDGTGKCKIADFGLAR